MPTGEPSLCSAMVPPQFHWAKSGTYVTQVSAVGPLGFDYCDPIDDPGTSDKVCIGTALGNA